MPSEMSKIGDSLAYSKSIQTMSSREIAELTNKNHSDVMRDIRSMTAKLQNAKMLYVCNSVTYAGDNGQHYPMYELDKDTTLTLLLGYDVVARMKVIKRWQELEQKQSLTIFGYDTNTHIGALKALTASLERIEQDKPKVAYFDALVDRNLLTNIRDTAKELHIKQNEFVKWLLEHNYVYRDSKEQLKPYAKHTPTLFELKEFICQHNGRAGNQLFVTPRGRETFRILLEGVAA